MFDDLWAPGGKTAHQYLLGRGFRKETERIRAGCALDSRSGTLDVDGTFRPGFVEMLQDRVARGL